MDDGCLTATLFRQKLFCELPVGCGVLLLVVVVVLLLHQLDRHFSSSFRAHSREFLHSQHIFHLKSDGDQLGQFLILSVFPPPPALFLLLPSVVLGLALGGGDGASDEGAREGGREQSQRLSHHDDDDE